MSDDYRVAPSGYDRYGPTSLYAPTAAACSRRSCSHTGWDSCRRCDGTSSDEWSVEKAAREAEQQRARQMRTSREFRATWLLTFHDPAIRREQADWADLRYGPMPGLLHDINENEKASA